MLPMSEYEEVNAGPNCVTMITVMPNGGTAPSTLTSSASGNTGNDNTALSSDNEVASMAAGASTRESETSSSEGGSFIIDSAAFYENLHFHNRMFKNPTAGQRTSIEDLSVIHSSSAQHPWVSKFGYSPKEVWNWLYTEHDLNHNLMQKQRHLLTNSSVKRRSGSQAVEVKFTLSEFVNCYKRLLGLNLEGFAEFVSRTLEAIVSTSMYYNQQKHHQKSSMTATRQKAGPSTFQCQKPNFVMVPTSLRQSSSQNKTYVRLSMPSAAQATQLLENNNHLTCYQTLMDVNNPKYASTTASGKKKVSFLIFTTYSKQNKDRYNLNFRAKNERFLFLRFDTCQFHERNSKPIKFSNFENFSHAIIFRYIFEFSVNVFGL